MNGKQSQELYHHEKFVYADGFLPPGLLGMGHIVGHAATTIWGEHRHSNAFEFIYVSKGRQCMIGCGMPQSLSRNSVFVAKPGVKHGGEHRLLRRCDAFWIMVNLTHCRNHFGEDFAVVADALEAISRMSFPVNPATGKWFWQLMDQRATPPDGFTVPTLAATLKALLTALARNYHAFITEETRRSAGGEGAEQRAIEWVNGRLTENWTVKDAAAAIRLKPSRFHELFIARTGYSPVDYRNRSRVEMAKTRLIDGGASITEIALDLGFCSSQYFAVIFRKYEGLTPSQYRRENLAHS